MGRYRRDDRQPGGTAAVSPSRIRPARIAPAAAPWRDRAGLTELAAILTPARIVGGAVRDALLGLDAADLDLATPVPPEDAMRRLAAAGIRTVPTGLKHGTVTALLPSGPVEVTTLRRDVETDGRHAVVAFGTSWEDDAARRDFTMNALYADPVTGELWDHHGGLDDLAAGRVRFIGEAALRIAEDRLRILRFFRFHARFGDRPDADGLAACAAAADGLAALSVERVAAEVGKLLVARGAVAAARLMLDAGVWAPVLPEVNADGTERLAVLATREAAAGIAPDWVRRLAALVPHATADAVGARLKLSRADRRRLAAAGAGPGGEGPLALAHREGVEVARDRLLLAGEDAAALADWRPRALPLSGGDLIAAGLARGPGVARALARVEDWWIAAGFPGSVPPAVVDQAVRDESSA